MLKTLLGQSAEVRAEAFLGRGRLVVFFLQVITDQIGILRVVARPLGVEILHIKGICP